MDDASVIVPEPSRTIFSWGLNPAQTQHVRSDLEKFTVNQLRNNYRGLNYDKNTIKHC